MTPRPSTKATSFDIAQAAGVSQPTVSRALRGDPVVSEATRARIVEIAQALHYKVDKNASALRRQQSDTLALLLFEDPSPDESMINPFFLAMLGSITRAAAAAGYDLLVSFQQLSADWHVDYADSRRADGMILLGYGDWADYRGRLEALDRQGTHYVRWGSVDVGGAGPSLTASDVPAATIGCDNEAGGRDATCHLIERGSRAIAFVGGTGPGSPELRARHRGYLAALAEAGITPDPALVVDAESAEADGSAAVRGLIARGVRFDGLFAASDLIAIGAVHALQDAGMAVPGDVRICGFDDIAAASLASPPLTTIRQDTARAGAMLVDMLVARLHGEVPVPITIPGTLVVRKSS